MTGSDTISKVSSEDRGHEMSLMFLKGPGLMTEITRPGVDRVKPLVG